MSPHAVTTPIDSTFWIGRIESSDRSERYWSTFGIDVRWRSCVQDLLVDQAGEVATPLAVVGVPVEGRAGRREHDDITRSGSIPGLAWFHFRGPDGTVYSLMQGSRAIAD